MNKLIILITLFSLSTSCTQKQTTLSYTNTTANKNGVITLSFSSTDIDLSGRGHYIICDLNSKTNNKFEIPETGIQARGNIESNGKPGQYKAEILLERNINNSSFILTTEDLHSALEKKDAVYCAVGQISYLSKPEFSSSIKIPKKDILQAFKNSNQP